MLPLGGWWVVASVLILVGLVLLVVPGIYLYVVLGASLSSVVVLERADLRRCFHLITGHWWATLGRLLLCSLVSSALQMVIQFVGMFAVLAVGLVLNVGSPGRIVGIVLAVVIGAPTMAALIVASLVPFTVMGLVTYAELRGHASPGFTTAQLAGELAPAEPAPPANAPNQ